MIGKFFGWAGVFAGAVAGATVGVWAQAPYPLSILERNVLTPVVKPGDDVRVELVVDRRQRCDQNVSHFIQYPNGDRDPNSRELSSTYGRMGRDVYVVRIPTDPTAPFGNAEVYSTGRAQCNPWQRYVKEVESGDPWHGKFRFGEATITKPGKYESISRGD